MSKYSNEYYQKHKDKIRASNKLWVEKNREKRQLIMSEYMRNRTPEQKAQSNKRKYAYFKTAKGRLVRNCIKRTNRALLERGIDKNKQECEVINCYKKAGVYHADYNNHFYIRWLCSYHKGEMRRNGTVKGLLSHY